MSISPVSLVGGLGMVAVGVGFFAYAIVRKLGFRYVVLGALFWLIAIALKLATAIPLNPRVFGDSKTLHDPWGTLLSAAYLGVLTGVFEVGAIWLILRWWRLGSLPWSAVLAVGIGFGGIEALLLGINSTVAAIVAITAPGHLPPAVLNQLAQADRWLFQLAPIYERFFTCLGHMATNAMIFYSLARRRSRWFWFAFVYKSLIDAVAGAALLTHAMATLRGVWEVEAVVGIWGLAGLFLTVWIARRYRLQVPQFNDEPLGGDESSRQGETRT